MGRLILFALIVVAVVLVWKAFGPGTWGDGAARGGGGGQASRIRDITRSELSRRRGVVGEDSASAFPSIKGPDDDEEFLWELDKKRFKERRARDREEQLNRHRERRMDKREMDKERERRQDPAPGLGDTESSGGSAPEEGRTDENGTSSGHSS